MIYEIVGVTLDGREVLTAKATQLAKAQQRAAETAHALAHRQGRGADGQDYRHVIVRAKGSSFVLHTYEFSAHDHACHDDDCGHAH